MKIAATVAVATAFASVICISPGASAETWRRHEAKKYGFSMLMPKGASVMEKAWPGGWVGLQADHGRTRLFGVTMRGKRNTADMIRTLAERLTGLERKHWTVDKKTIKARAGWVWYCVARAEDGHRVALAVYGIGRAGTYLMLLVSTRADARKNRAAHARWARGVRLARHGR